MLKQILLGIFISAIGILMVWKTSWAIEMIGMNAWAERTFGGGGTRTFYKLMGVLVIIVGFIITTDLFDVVFGGMIMSLFGVK
ncbi:MAG: hypothetical protein WCT24_02310 [Patescibacteria group bacterium]|jgi:hypothetical protein